MPEFVIEEKPGYRRSIITPDCDCFDCKESYKKALEMYEKATKKDTKKDAGYV